MSLANIVILGGGQAGLQAAVSVRHHGYEKKISIIAEEPVPPNQRPPRSKAL